MVTNSLRRASIGLLVAAGVSGCVVVPVGPDGTPMYPGVPASVYPALALPVPAVQVPGPYFPAPVPGRSDRGAMPAPVYPPPAPAGPAAPASLQARLYPSNEVAAQTGLLSGTVTNMMTGTGVFQLNYNGEILSGEATRVPGDDRRGVAHAYGQRGTYMSCDYRMTTPYQGTGTCSLSTGAQFQVHIGG